MLATTITDTEARFRADPAGARRPRPSRQRSPTAGRD